MVTLLGGVGSVRLRVQCYRYVGLLGREELSLGHGYMHVERYVGES